LAQIFSSEPSSQASSIHVIFSVRETTFHGQVRQHVQCISRHTWISAEQSLTK